MLTGGDSDVAMEFGVMSLAVVGLIVLFLVKRGGGSNSNNSNGNYRGTPGSSRKGKQRVGELPTGYQP